MNLILLQNTLNDRTLEPLQLERLLESILEKQTPQDEIGMIAAHVTKRLSDLVPVTTLTTTINSPEQTLPDNLQTVLMSKEFLGLRNILKRLISSEETKDFLSNGFMKSSKRLLEIFENLEKKHSPTHIATRIKELILGQGISAEDFSSLIWEELQRHNDNSLQEQVKQTLLKTIKQEFPSQPAQQQENLKIEKKLKNLLEKTEFVDLVEILTHLPLDTPNNHSANLTLALVQSFLLSVNCEAKDNQPPIITTQTQTQTQTQTPTPTATATATLVSLLPFSNQPRTA